MYGVNRRSRESRTAAGTVYPPQSKKNRIIPKQKRTPFRVERLRGNVSNDQVGTSDSRWSSWAAFISGAFFANGEMGSMLPQVLLSYKRLFRYADGYDITMMLLGTAGCVINGFSLPAISIIQSHVYNKYGRLESDASEASKQAILCVYIAAVTLVGAYLEISCWIYTAHRQARRLRIKYASCILSQDSAYFDCKCSSSEVINHVSADMVHVQEALGEKLGNFIETICLFIGSFIASMVLAPRMTLMVSPFMLVLLLPGFMYSRALSNYATQRHNSYSAAGKIAEQAISSIRVVYSFVAEKRTLNLYSKALEGSYRVDVMQGLAKGLALGFHGLRYGVWGIMTWYGGTLVAKGQINGAQVLIAGSAFVVGSMTLGNAIQHLKELSDGHAALCRIFQVIESRPEIDIDSSSGKMLKNIRGELELKNVVFAYPSRPGVLVLKDFNLHIAPGKTTAIVGRSGSGKSTVISLLQRFYDPLSGEVLLNGANIKDLQLRWYRQRIGLVSQEPTLFSFSIKENILLGKEDSSMDEVIAAAKKADAHTFIMKLPEGYDTQVGVRGMQLSGGQKQRIAIARAIIRNPSILLLDEATSALDNVSESTVQKAIQQACIDRTAVVIAHKLLSIQSADLIAVVDMGKVVEFGSHEDLLAKKPQGAYFDMFQLQDMRTNHVRDASKEAATINRESSIVELRTFPVEESRNRLSTTKQQKLSFTRLLLMNRSEWKHCLLGLVGAVCIGFIHPAFVAVGADAVSSFYAADYNKVRHRIKIDAAIFAALSALSILFNIIQHYSFGEMGAVMTRRIREQMLAKMLQFEVGWFDQEENSSGALCSRLATNASMVRTLVGDRISILVQTGSTIGVSLIASFVVSWRLTVAITSIQPLILICFYFRVNNLQGFAKKAAQIQARVSQLVLEGVTQHQTVTAFGSQARIVNMLKTRLESLGNKAVLLSQIAGISSGVALFTLLSSYGLCIWYGGHLIAEGKCTLKDFLLIFYLLIGTGRSLADTLALSPDISQGMAVAESVFEILERKTSCNSEDHTSKQAGEVKGRIEFEKVCFAYPSRPNMPVLRNFNLTVEVAQTVAIVGRSGSGKSTIVGLVERFYDPQSGCIRIDGKDIKQLQLDSLRQQIGLVSQEPTLFALSIQENIAYGKENATDAEIMEAARAANAHTFISALPHGYSTFAGEVGVQLSGGQKQRIAIARAILKRPAILLLDEATSALDAKSESIVQDALDKLMVARTTIVVAHRLSTIQNADVIAVVQDGAIVEQGSHKELLAKGKDGAFFSLTQA